MRVPLGLETNSNQQLFSQRSDKRKDRVAMMRILFRFVLLILSAAILVFVVYVVVKAQQTGADQIRLMDFDAVRAALLQSVRDDSQRFFQMAVVVLGSVLGVALVKKDDRLNRRDWPEILMVLMAISLFSIFFYFNHRYSETLVRSYWDALSLPGKRQLPDFMDSPYLERQHDAFVSAFYGGLVVSGLAVLSICKMRGSQIQ
jgi:magnesium-transporting ATPase (P-type)